MKVNGFVWSIAGLSLLVVTGCGKEMIGPGSPQYEAQKAQQQQQEAIRAGKPVVIHVPKSMKPPPDKPTQPPPPNVTIVYD